MRKIFVLIERRADYSRYKPILEELQRDPFFEIYIVVTGICLLELHGNDVNYIEKDGFTINSKIQMFNESNDDTGAEMVRSLSRILHAITYELEKVKPDIVLSGFDIGGNFAVTIAAAHMNIPVAHIQGGEVTGSIDESIRHAMSKFAHIHFPATELSRQRLIRMGENPDYIFTVGCPSIDVLLKTPAIPRRVIEENLNIDLSLPTLLLIQHPVTTEDIHSLDQIRNTIEAIIESGVQCITSLPNNDAGSSKIIEYIKTNNIKWYPSLSTEIFVNLYRNVSAIIGNSSSGIHESSTMKIPAINIGSRQQGRERPKNVIDVTYNKDEIVKAINKAVFDNNFRESVKSISNPYGDGKTAVRIKNVLKEISLNGIIQKIFYD